MARLQLEVQLLNSNIQLVDKNFTEERWCMLYVYTVYVYAKIHIGIYVEMYPFKHIAY